MGNLCSKSSNEADSFATPGRTLGSNTQPKPVSAPLPAKITTSTPGRALGGVEGSSNIENARSAAAKAAEERAAKANKTGGKLANQLSAQKKQTQNQLLNSGSEAERRVRDVDQVQKLGIGIESFFEFKHVFGWTFGIEVDFGCKYVWECFCLFQAG